MDKITAGILKNFLDALNGYGLVKKTIKYTQQQRDEELLFKILMAGDLRVEDVKDEYKDLARVILKHKEARNDGRGK